VSRRPGFEALAPFFRIIAEGLSGLVDGEDFFDMLAEDAARGRAHRHEFAFEWTEPGGAVIDE
jgi:hypothetical protein